VPNGASPSAAPPVRHRTQVSSCDEEPQDRARDKMLDKPRGARKSKTPPAAGRDEKPDKQQNQSSRIGGRGAIHNVCSRGDGRPDRRSRRRSRRARQQRYENNLPTTPDTDGRCACFV